MLFILIYVFFARILCLHKFFRFNIDLFSCVIEPILASNKHSTSQKHASELYLINNFMTTMKRLNDTK